MFMLTNNNRLKCRITLRFSSDVTDPRMPPTFGRPFAAFSEKQK